MDWPALREAVVNCRACKLCESRRQTVFGVGHEHAHWMIVGEAPGEQEDRQGEPFVGKSGQLLDNMLRALGLSRKEVPPAGGTSLRLSPRARSMLSSNWPDLPTKGSPCRSSCSPGASPTIIQCARGLPTPNTVWRRPVQSLQAVQAATVSRSAGQSSVAT